MSVSHTELVELLDTVNPFRLSMQKLARSAVRGKIGAVGLAVALGEKTPMPPVYQPGTTTPTIDFLEGFANSAGRVLPGAQAHAGILISSRVPAEHESEDDRWLPTPAQLKGWVAVAVRHRQAIGGSIVRTSTNEVSLTLFRARTGTPLRADLIAAIPGRASPLHIEQTMGTAGLAAANVTFDMPSMLPASSLDVLGNLYAR